MAKKKKQTPWGPPAESAERPRSNHQKRVRLWLVNLPLPNVTPRRSKGFLYGLIKGNHLP